MSKLRDLTSSYVSKNVSVTEMEMGLLKTVLVLCLNLLKYVLKQKSIEYQDALPNLIEGEYLKKSGKRTRKYLRLFGALEYKRSSCISDQRGMLYMTDEVLTMPTGLWSYNIQDLVGSQASHVNFRSSVELLNNLLGLELSGMGSERNVSNLGDQVESYYEQKEAEKQPEAVCYSDSFDGKGVPMIIEVDKHKVKEIKRLKKGQKNGKKRMATVGVMSTFSPKKREVSSIIRGLMGIRAAKGDIENSQIKSLEKDATTDNNWHKDIHRRGFLSDQEKCIAYGISYIKDRINHPESRFVVPIDAGIGLEDKVLKYVEQYGLQKQFDGIILDIIHVSEYVWAAANAIFGENSNLRINWVKTMLEDLLNSKTKQVIKDLQNIVDKANLKETKKEKIKSAITYFTNHQHKMDYKSFLEKGYPVSSALVESTCKHLVKDRMEHSGMRWSNSGAQKMLDIRAVKVNGDMKDFMGFVAKKSKKVDLNIAA